MIWHIFKKDLRLTWKIALAAAVVQWLDAVLVVAIGVGTGTFGDPVAGTAAARLEPLRQMVHVLAFVATALAAATAVHNDPLPPPTDDWLVRPIRRIDMMLAKVLFFLVAIEGPIFLGSLAASIGLGLGLPQAIYPAIVHACATAVWFGLFSLGLGAVTSNVVEALVGGFACLVLFVLMFFTGNAFGGAANYGENSRAIVIGALTAGIAVSGLLAFVSQFHRRKTHRSRAIALTLFAAGAAVSLLPKGAAMALADGVSQVSPTAWRTHLVLDPSGGRASSPWLPAQVDGEHDVSWLAFRVTGMRSGESLIAEPRESNALVIDETGVLRLRNHFFADNHGFLWLGIHGNERRKLKHSVSVSATYAFSVVHEAGTYPIAASGGVFRVPGGLGTCRAYYLTGTSGDGALSCVTPLPNSACFELTAERVEQIHFPCWHDPSSTLSWLWDWNDLPRSGGSMYAQPHSALFLHAYERTGTLTGQVDLGSVQPGDWLAPPERE